MPNRYFSEYVPGRLCGRMRQTPIYNVESQSIYDALHSAESPLSPADREALIVKRANWVTQVKLRVPLHDFNWDSYELALYEAQFDTRRHLKGAQAPEYMPHEQPLRARFRNNGPPQIAERVEEIRAQLRSAVESGELTLANQLPQSLANFQASDICEVMLDTLSHILQTVNVARISKILALGSNSYFHWNDGFAKASDDSLQTICNERICEDRKQMWMSLLAMRALLFDQGAIDDICPVLVQDTSLRKTETTQLRQVGIVALCGAYGHQQGFAEIDSETLLVLFCNDREILGLIQEIADPPIVYLNEIVTTRAPLPSESVKRAEGYKLGRGWHGSEPTINIPSGHIEPDYERFHETYTEVPLAQFDHNKPLLGRTVMGRHLSFFIRKNLAKTGVSGPAVHKR